MKKWGIVLIVLGIAFLAFTGLAAATGDDDTYTRCVDCCKYKEASQIQNNPQSNWVEDARARYDPKKHQIPLTPELDNLPANRTLAEKFDHEPFSHAIWHINDNLLPEEVRKQLGTKPLTEEEKAIRVADVRWLDENRGYRIRTMTVGDFAREYSTSLVGGSVGEGWSQGYYTISARHPCSGNITEAQKRDLINLCNFMLAYGKQSGYESELPLLVITNTLCESKPDRSATIYIQSTSDTKESMVSPAIGALSSRFDEFRPLIAGIQYYVFTDLGDPHTGNAIAATLGFPATKSDGTAVMVTCGHGNPGKSDTSFKEPSNSAYQPNVDDDYKYGNVGDRTLANLDASYHTFASGISASAKIYDKKWAEDDHKVPILKYTNTPIDPKDKVTVSGRSSDQIDMDYVEFCTSSVLSEAIYEGDHNAPGCIYDKESKRFSVSFRELLRMESMSF